MEEAKVDLSRKYFPKALDCIIDNYLINLSVEGYSPEEIQLIMKEEFPTVQFDLDKKVNVDEE